MKRARPSARAVGARLAGLRQKTLFRIAAAYAVGAWLIIQVAATVAPALGLSGWFLRAVILLAVLGFVATVGFFAFVRPVVSKPARTDGRPNRLASLAVGAALLIAAVFGVGYVARQTLFATEQVSLAVLPFADMSPGRDKAFLAEGVAEEILSALGKNADLKVLGRSSSFALRDRAGDPAAIRAALGVTHLLEGSVRSAGSDLRLSVRLIRTADGRQEWAEDYRGRSDDVFALQDQVANAVAMRLSALGRDKASTPQAEVTSADAYNLYLAARQIARTRSEPELKRAFALTQKVVNAKPDFAPGHALLGELTWMLSDDPISYGHIPVAKARPVAIDHAQKAIELTPQSADGYAALGLALSGRGGDQPLLRALKLDPTRSEIPLWLAIELGNTERGVDALKYLRQAVAIDPLWAPAVSRLTFELANAGRNSEATQAIDRFEAHSGNHAQAARFRSAGANFRADLSEIARWGERALRLDPQIPFTARYIHRAYSVMGLTEQARRIKPDTAQPIRHAFFVRGPQAAVAAGEPLGAGLWDQPDVAFYTFSLGARRDWGRLVSLFDKAPVPIDDICHYFPRTATPLALALRKFGREDPARGLLDCIGKRVWRAKYDGPRQPYGADQAQLLSIAGKPDQAITALNRMIDQGWFEVSFRLADFSAFDSLAGRPDFAAVQARLDTLVARERAETLASH